MLRRRRADSHTAAPSSTQCVEDLGCHRIRRLPAPGAAANVFFSFSFFFAAANVVHLVFIKTEGRDGKRNPETSSRRQDNPSQNLSQNVERHRVFMATCIPEVLALVLISSFVGATTPENGTAEPGSLPLQGASAQLVGTNNNQQPTTTTTSISKCVIL